jgi:hypothetical protein
MITQNFLFSLKYVGWKRILNDTKVALLKLHDFGCVLKWSNANDVHSQSRRPKRKSTELHKATPSIIFQVKPKLNNTHKITVEINRRRFSARIRQTGVYCISQQRSFKVEWTDFA